MTYGQKIKELKKLRSLYIDFLKSNEGDDEDDWLLIAEIKKLQEKIELYEHKKIVHLNKKFPEGILKKDSIINYSNLKPRDIRVIAMK